VAGGLRRQTVFAVRIRAILRDYARAAACGEFDRAVGRPESTTTTSSAKVTLARQLSSCEAALRVMIATDKGMGAKKEPGNPYNQRLMLCILTAFRAFPGAL